MDKQPSIASQKEKFTTLLQEHIRIIYKIVHSYCKVEADRKDLEQEIVLQLWKSYGNYNEQYQFSTWLYRVALNTAISFYRKERVRNEYYTQTDYVSIINVTEEEAIPSEKEQQLKLLQQFINELSDLNKAIMLLYLEEKSHQEIADIIGISKSNVGTKINRIKTKLKAKFKNRQK